MIMVLCCGRKTEWVSERLDYEVEVVETRGRPQRTWKEVVETGMTSLKIKRKTFWFAVNGEED